MTAVLEPDGGLASPQPLAGIRVVECGDTIAAAYAGRLLADMGASVAKLEPDEGDPLRSVGPFVGGIPDCDMSASFAYYHRGKHTICVSGGSADPLLGPLVRSADVLVRSTSDGRHWISDETLTDGGSQNPGLVVCDISTYGRDGSGPAGMSDLLALAASGLLSVNGTHPTSPQSKPLRYRGELGSTYAACQAVLAIVAALFHRTATATGDHIDVSAQASVASVLGTGPARYSYTGALPVRNGTRVVAPWGIFACSDGNVMLQVAEDDQWRGLLKALGDPDWGHLEIFETTAKRELVTDVVGSFVAEALRDLTVEDFITAALEASVPAAPVQDAEAILGWDHLAARRYLQPVSVENGLRTASLPIPSRAWRYHYTEPPVVTGPRRLADGRRRELPAWAHKAPASPPPAHDSAPTPGSPGRSGSRPLDGVRVLDLTLAWAGPLAAMYLAHLGAEVIKIESATRADVTRRLPPYADDIPGIDRSGYFNHYNQGKKSITVDLKHSRGRELLEALIGTCDVIIDNLRPGSLERMGFPYSELARINPRIVAVSMTGFGDSGPERNRGAYGSIIDALGGASAANGEVGGGPTDLMMSLPDPTSGMHAAIATLGALMKVRRTGSGEHIDFAMIEACLAAFPWPVLHKAATGAEIPVIGNRDERSCPHGVYPCRGDDQWLALAVPDDSRFQALLKAMVVPDLAADRFATMEKRRIHENELDAIITEWSSGLDVDDAVARLRRHGVLAEKVWTVGDIFRSRDLLTRRFFSTAAHPEVGTRPLPGVGWRARRLQMQVTSAAPTLGQHTRQILTGVLAMTDAEIDELDRQRVLQ